jgi:hypothetical protein
VWQRIYDELKGKGLMVVSAALDSAGVEAASPWIDRAKPAYPCLIDQHHELADLYGFTNVPMAVWIDEQGMIVRGPEPAGASDAFRRMDRKDFSLPEDARAQIRESRTRYTAAIRDWAENGPSSRFVQLGATGGPPSREFHEAQARFALGQYLYRRGQRDEGTRLLEEAKAMLPESWSLRRQSWALEDPAKAGGPEFWAAVDALGDRPYYAPVKLDE